jgi:T5orf172 domain
MSGTVAASHFPSFYKFSPDDDRFTCIHPCKTKGFQRCKSRVSRDDRVAAAGLRTDLASLAVEEGQLEQTLERYAALCCCKRSHRDDAKELGRFQVVVSEWLAELDRHKSKAQEVEAGATWSVIVTNSGTELAQGISSHSNAQESGKQITPVSPESSLTLATAVGQPTPATPSNSSSSSLNIGRQPTFAVLRERQERIDSYENTDRKKEFPGQVSDKAVLGSATGSSVQETAKFNLAVSKPQRFILYKSRRPNDVLGLKIPSPLTPAQSRNGTLYMIKREADPGFFKIGYTTLVADDRFAWIEKQCRYVPIPIRQIRHVPCVKRVELLVHIELMQQRRKETTCIDNPDCRATHAEWFEVDEAIAMGVMDRWAKWMVEAEPYGVDGLLTKEWVQICRNLQAIGELPTSANLLEAMRNLYEQQVSRHSTASAFSVGKNLVNLFSELEITTKCLYSKPFEQQE